MSRRLPAVLALAAAAGCATPTWKEHLVGAGLPKDKVIVIGSFVTVPPITQRGVHTPTGPVFTGNGYEPEGGTVFVGKMAGHVAGIFTADLSEPWQQGAIAFPFDRYDWAWFPMGGTFFVEVPRVPRLHLRGVLYVTDGGNSRIEVPGFADLPAEARVVYVGEIRVVRSGDRRILFNDRFDQAREAAKAVGHADVLAVPWRKSLLRPLEPPRTAERTSR